MIKKSRISFSVAADDDDVFCLFWQKQKID
jgi:hypothetical protein